MEVKDTITENYAPPANYDFVFGHLFRNRRSDRERTELSGNKGNGIPAIPFIPFSDRTGRAGREIYQGRSTSAQYLALQYQHHAGIHFLRLYFQMDLPEQNL